MSPIIDIQRRLVEVGRVRMGRKGDKGQPQKLDTWRLTSSDKARLEAAAELFGGTVQDWVDSPKGGEYELVTTTAELPILLLPGQALSQWHELWGGGGCLRRCDGEREILSDSPCLCATEEGDRKCKPTTRLSVMLPDVPGLGCWRLESHGYYAAVELSATALMLEQATARGQMFPARLRIDQRREVRNGQTRRYPVPVIDIDVRFREAVQGISARTDVLEAPSYTPLAQLSAGVTVEEGLALADAVPKVRSGRQAAPIPAGDEIPFGDEPVPVPDDAPPDDKRTPAQAKKLNVLVGKLRPDHITTEQLWAALGKSRNVDMETHVATLEGRDSDGVLHWSPLRDSLTKLEATDLIDRLDRLEANVGATA